MTPEESRLLSSLPGDESAVLRAFFEECDARLIEDGGGSEVPGCKAGELGLPVNDPAKRAPTTNQDALFPMRKEARP